MMHYLVRPYRANDFEKLAARYIELSRRYGRTTTQEEIAETLKRPGFDPERDILLATIDNRIIGYIHVTPEPGISRVFINGWIDPAHRRKGIASDMLDRILTRCRETEIRTIGTSIPQENRTSRMILPRMGFRMVRRYLDFYIRTDSIKADTIGDVCQRCRQLHPGEEAAVMALQNRVFQQHWRYNQYDLPAFIHDINLNNRSSEDIVVHTDEQTINGYCWTEIIRLSAISGTETRGIINMIGVDKTFQRKGFGRQVLLAGMVYLKQKGAEAISLQVDSENKPARRLYRSVGFSESSSSLWYERQVPQGTATGKSAIA